MNATMLMLVAGAMVIALVLGYHVARDIRTTLFIITMLFAVLTIQHHHPLSVAAAVIFFPSAFVLGFLPGRPFVWEVMPLLGIVGLVTTFALRREIRSPVRSFPGTRLGLWGAVGYCLVLLVLMNQRGFGMRVMGGDEFGGRFYLQQLLCATFPFIFLACIPSKESFIKLIVIGQLLSFSYLISDLLLQLNLLNVLGIIMLFIDFSTDSINFYQQSLAGGIQRFQSVGNFSYGIILLLLIYKRPSHLVKSIWIPFVMLVLIGLATLGGHRSTIIKIIFIIAFWLFVHRVYRSPVAVITAISLLVVGYLSLVAWGDQLPAAMQRSFEFIPGVAVDPLVQRDADGTMAMRRLLRETGWRMIPDYLWLGAGFTFPSQDLTARYFDPTGFLSHLQSRTFYNGFIGLMVNTGLPGTFFMLLFMFGGSVNAWYITRTFMQGHRHDLFSRAAAMFAGVWFFNVLFFLFLHGDSEKAMKSFAFQFALLLIFTHYLLVEELKAPREKVVASQ